MDKEKTEEFIQEYGKLVEKYKIDFAPVPQFVPTEKGVWGITIQNIPISLEKDKKFFNNETLTKD